MPSLISEAAAVVGENLRLFPTIALLLLAVSALNVQPAKASTTPQSIPVPPDTWSKPHLAVVVYPNPSLSWYSDAYLANVSKGVRVWQDSVDRFADMYPRYSYLRQLYFSTYVHGVNDSSVSADVSVRFDGQVPSGSVGITYTCTLSPTNASCPATIHFAPGWEFSGIAAHEFGLALGLGEPSTSDYVTGDLMDHAVSVAYPSTLDLYALAFKYQWLQSGSFYYAYPGPCGCVSLPSSVAYAEVVPYQAQLSQVQAQLSQAQLQLSDYETVAARLSSELSSAQANATALSAQLSALSSNLTSLDRTLADVRQQLQASSANDTALSSENAALSSQAAADSQAVSSLRQQLATAQSALDQKTSTASQIVYWQALSVALIAALAATVVYSRRRIKGAAG